MRLIIISIIGGYSSFVYSEDLLDIYRLALLNDPTFEVARYSLKTEKEKLPQARGGFLPKIDVVGINSLSNVRNHYSNAPRVNRELHEWNWALRVTQPLMNIHNYYTHKEAKFISDRAAAEYNLAQQDMILRLIQAYFGVMSGFEEISVYETELLAAEEQLKLATAGHEKGLATLTDVLEANSRVNIARFNLVEAQNNHDVKKVELEKIIDVFPGQLAPLSDDAIISPPEPNDLKHWVEFARQSNPAVKVAQFGLLVSEVVVKKAKAAHAPTVDLIASMGENYASGNVTTPTDFASRGETKKVEIQFTIPLFEGGVTSSIVAESFAQKYRAGAELEVARRQAETDARIAYFGVINGLAQISALNSVVESGKMMVDESQVGYKLGVYNNFKVLDAVQKYFGAKRDLVKARYETLFHALKLKASVGILTEGDLLVINEFLEH